MTRVIGWPCAAPATGLAKGIERRGFPISPNTTPILPSVRAQKPVVTGPSRASVDVTLTAMMMEKTLTRLILIRSAIDALADGLSTRERSIGGGNRMSPQRHTRSDPDR